MNTKKKILLSKSKIKDMIGCELMLHNQINRPKDKVWQSNNLKVFDQGREVEALARAKYTNGVLQDKLENFEKLTYTKELMKTHDVIFEAAFAKRDTIIQFDILIKNEDKTYNAKEIKSSGKFKDDFETDVLIQYWIATLAGVTIKNFEVWFVNKDATSKDELFAVKDVTEFVKSNYARFDALVDRALGIALLKKAPDVKRSVVCDRLECPFRSSCGKVNDETTDSVFNLPRFPNAWAAYNLGIETVNDERFDATYKYTELNPLIIRSIRENKLVVDKDGFMEDFNKWVFPLNFFDFETLMAAIPILEKQKPFQQVVIQFSNHTLSHLGATKLVHSEYLHDKLSDPTREAALAILEALEANKGSIVSYNMTFEKTQIKNLAKVCPDLAERLLALVDRFVDLMDLIKDYVYHPEFKGSYSLKSVSPALLKEFGSYTDSIIKSGSEISTYFQEMLETKDEARKQELKLALLKYCKYDTLNLFLVIMYVLNQDENIEKLVYENL